MQEAYCVKCPDAKYDKRGCRGGKPCTMFASKRGRQTQLMERRAFATQCLPKAFNKDGTIKAEFKCPDEDAKLAAAEAMSF